MSMPGPLSELLAVAGTAVLGLALVVRTGLEGEADVGLELVAVLDSVVADSLGLGSNSVVGTVSSGWVIGTVGSGYRFSGCCTGTICSATDAGVGVFDGAPVSLLPAVGLLEGL